MSTSKKEIQNWFTKGVRNKNKYLIVVCDTFDWEDYPVFCKDLTEAKQQFLVHNGQNMQKVMEIYNLEKDMVSQLNKHRATCPEVTSV